jgi:hypothetical protein
MFVKSYEFMWLSGKWWDAYGRVSAETITQDASSNLSWTIPAQNTVRDDDSQVVTVTAP